MDAIDEEGSSRVRRESDDDDKQEIIQKHKETQIELVKSSSSNSNVNEISRGNELIARVNRPAPLEILKSVKFNTHQETPRSTIKGFLNIPTQNDLKFSKDNLKKAEARLKKAFVEFYHKLRLLKSYRYPHHPI